MDNNSSLKKLESLLLQNEGWLVEGVLNKNKVAELARKYDAELLNTLQSEPSIKGLFFTETDSGLVFKKDTFLQFLANKSFLPDSYTAYRQKIGLATGVDDYLIRNKEVVLNWPYKDAILEGGQDKEDAKRKEVFFNEVLAPDQINRLLDDKVFIEWKRHDKNGANDLDELKDDDNLIIKGNNLVALHSLKKRFAGKIKLIYIDPPYNTGGDTFGYNDSFSHSTWLTFMKNRLQVAHELLREDGVIFISIDGNEFAYLSVLMDEMFKRENLLEVFHFQVRYANKSLNERDDFQPVIEYGLAYAKNKSLVRPNKPKEQYKSEKFNLDIQETSPPDRTFNLPDGRQVDVFLPHSYKIEKVVDDRLASLDYFKETWITGSIYSDTGHGTMYKKAVEPNVSVDGYGVMYKIHGLGEDGLGYRYMTGPKKESARFGKMYAKIPLDKKAVVLSGVYEKPVPIVNYYDFSAEVGNIRHEGGVRFNKGKKPEKMMRLLVGIFTDPEDIVLDYHLGSGTTAAVAHKMGRQYIGIEQIMYGENDPIVRMRNVLNGDETGVSSHESWKGGGSFVSTALMNDANKFRGEVEDARTDEELIKLLAQAKKSSFLSYRVDPEKIKLGDKGFTSLSMADKKRTLLSLIDSNTLYVNYSDIDDQAYEITPDEKRHNRTFYGDED